MLVLRKISMLWQEWLFNNTLAQKTDRLLVSDRGMIIINMELNSKIKLKLHYKITVYRSVIKLKGYKSTVYRAV